MHHHVFMFGMARRTCVAASLLLTALCAPNSGLNAAESVEPVTPTSQRVEADEASREQILATADDLQAHGKTTEALALLADFVKNHPRDQVAKAHLLDLRVKQKENEIRATLQEQSDNQDLILSDPEYQTLAARAHEDIRKRLAVVEYFLGQNRLNEAAQGCNTILRDYPHDPAAMRLKFRILNTIVARERKELEKNREYRRDEAMSDVLGDSFFPREPQRVHRQVFIFQEDIDDLERTRVRERLQEKVSLNHDQAKVWDVMRTLFAVAGINYVVLDSAVGEETVSLHLVDDTVESALSVIGKLAKVRFSYTDGTVFVSSDADDGLVTEIIRLRSGLTNVEAEVKGTDFNNAGGSNQSGGGGGSGNGIPPGLPPQGQQAFRNPQQGNGQGSAGGTDLEKFLNKLPDIIVGWQDTHKWHLDRKSNTLYLRANPWVISEVKRLLHALDYNNVQVLIESRFIEVTEEAMRQLGVDWGAFQGTNPATATWAGGNGKPIAPATVAGGTNPVSGSLTSGAAVGPGGVISGLVQQNGFTLNASLKALEADRQADTLAEPKILTLNNAKGLIEITKTNNYVSGVTFQSFSNSSTTNTNNGAIISNSGQVPQPQFSEVKEGYQLEITPSLARNSDVITLKLKPTVQKVTGFTDTPISYQPSASATKPEVFTVRAPQFATRTLETVLHVQNGKTLALGGLSDALEEKTTAGTPFVQRIPVLGWLFKTETRQSQRRNLLILVTANIVDPSGANVNDDITHLRDTARILMPEGVVQGMEPDKPVMIEPSQPAGPVAQPNPLMNKGRRP
jgi:type II secretory pathway component GspD/PulD (secretin)